MSEPSGEKELTAQQAANAFVLLWSHTQGRTMEGLRDGIASLLVEAFKRGEEAKHSYAIKALKEMKSWSEEVLNADQGEVGYELREFAQEIYGECCKGLGL